MILNADARHMPLADESVHCVVTSPPYWGLRDYSAAGQIGLESSLGEYLDEMMLVADELWRVLRTDGTLWLNIGDAYVSRQQGSQGKNGWMYGRGVTRARLTQRKRDPGLKTKDLVGLPWRIAFALQERGWYLRSDIVWSKPNPMPESVRDRPTKSHEYMFLLAKSQRYYFDQEAVREPDCGRPSGNGFVRPQQISRGGMGREDQWIPGAGRNIRTVWTINTQPYPGSHFATFPEALARRCILAGCPEGGIVLDPFSGSGTTVRVARSLGRLGVGLDINPEYLRLAQKRIRTTQGLAFGG